MPELNTISYRLPAPLSGAVGSRLTDWTSDRKVPRLWARDAALWTGADEDGWLGWLDAPAAAARELPALQAFAADVRSAGFRHILLLGMGGSSLCPEVLRMTFGVIDGFPELHVLDSTDPAQAAAFDARTGSQSTLYIVASKSGSTLEPNIFKQYFFDRAGRDGSRFVAITDPGSKMQQVAEADRFRRIFFGVPSIGGRYSALSNFGLVPAAAMGLDLSAFLSRTNLMVDACRSADAASNPGAVLGVILGEAARAGRDKVTLISSSGISDLGAWLEQLLAESTGKLGHGLIPVDREALAAPQVYGQDRVFVYLRLDSAADPAQDRAIDSLEKAGHPVIRIGVLDTMSLGQEFFRWEIATAVAGAVIGIHPFDQPDVEASKVETRKLTTAFEDSGKLPAEKAFFEENGIRLFADPANAAAIGQPETLAQAMKSHLGRLGQGDYFALLAYIEMSDAHETALQAIRHAVRDSRRAATCLGFGPRFLHSTGQAYKGGPNSGVFLQITCDDKKDLPVPGQKYTFGIVKAAQARGDFEVLAARGRRVLRVHLTGAVPSGLSRLREAVLAALYEK